MRRTKGKVEDLSIKMAKLNLEIKTCVEKLFFASNQNKQSIAYSNINETITIKIGQCLRNNPYSFVILR